MQQQLLDQVMDFIRTRGTSLLTALLIVVAGMLLVRLLIKLLRKAIERSKLDPTYHRFLLSLTKYALYVVVWIVALSQLNVDMTSIVTMLGVGGLAISLAVKDSLANVAGGFIVLFTKPFKVGDFVELEGLSGTVEHINTFQTKLVTFDNKAVYIPNGQVAAARITNYSAEEKRLLVLNFGVDYTTNMELAKRVIMDLLSRNEMVLTEPEPAVRIVDYASNSIQLSIRVWVKTEQYWDLNWALMEDVKRVFDRHGINIPYNKLDINFINSASAPIIRGDQTRSKESDLRFDPFTNRE